MKLTLPWRTLLLGVALGAAAFAEAQQTLPPGFRQASDTHWVSGQPEPVQLAAIKAQGIRQIIVLRPAEEHPLLEAEAAAAGLGYRSLPIAGAASLTRENVAALDDLLAEVGDQPTLIHCASGNRVGAMMALRAAWIEGADAEAALALGGRYGLTGLEDAVRERLSGGDRD